MIVVKCEFVEGSFFKHRKCLKERDEDGYCYDDRSFAGCGDCKLTNNEKVLLEIIHKMQDVLKY